MMNPKDIVNFIILVAKFHLYTTRCKGELLNCENLYGELIFIRNIEKYNAASSNLLHKHDRKWFKEA